VYIALGVFVALALIGFFMAVWQEWPRRGK
jgi:hypothetical protein